MKVIGSLTVQGFLDLLQNELRNARLQNLASAPSSPGVGQMYFDTTLGYDRIWTGTLWINNIPGTTYTDEEARDAVAALIAAATHTGITITYTDSGTGIGTLAFAVTNSPLLGGQTLAQVRDRTTHTGQQASTTISDFTSAVNALVAAGVAAVVDTAPGTLDTLNELAAALGDNPNFATDITALIAAKVGKYTTLFGNGSLTSFTITHGFTTTNIASVLVFEVASGEQVYPIVTISSTTTITLSGWTTAPTSNQYRVVVSA
jgi:hypothetical protein